jgi:16S rRNA (cytidine1402-2'-O)-methyltransferase
MPTRRERRANSTSPAAGARADSRPPAPVAQPKPFAPGLYVAATPIGNARDVTLRLLDLLAAADLVACEDTRVTAKLLSLHGLSRPLFAYHDHNAHRAGPVLMERLKRGEIVALLSDAGTPLVSDPGYGLVREAIAAGVAVTALPGPSAALAALTLSGLPAERFLFAGFLPPKQAARLSALAELAAVPATLIFYESPNRLPDALADMATALGPRPAAVARELTKLFEEVRRAPLDALASHYAEAGPPKGEVVVRVARSEAPRASDEEVDAALAGALSEMSASDAAAEVARATSRPRREVYARALALKGRG